jgi:hypothetical protein
MSLSTFDYFLLKNENIRVQATIAYQLTVVHADNTSCAVWQYHADMPREKSQGHLILLLTKGEGVFPKWKKRLHLVDRVQTHKINITEVTLTAEATKLSLRSK